MLRPSWYPSKLSITRRLRARQRMQSGCQCTTPNYHSVNQSDHKVNIGLGEAHNSVTAAWETGFIDPTGKFVLPPRFFYSGKFQDGLCIFDDEKSIRYVTQESAVVWSSGWVEHLNFNPLSHFSSGTILVIYPAKLGSRVYRCLSLPWKNSRAKLQRNARKPVCARNPSQCVDNALVWTNGTRYSRD
jgi:hypothetical protein